MKDDNEIQVAVGLGIRIIKNVLAVSVVTSTSLVLQSVVGALSIVGSLAVLWDTALQWMNWVLIAVAATTVIINIYVSQAVLRRNKNLFSLVVSSTVNLTIQRIVKSRKKDNLFAEELALSMTYFNHLKNGHASLKMALLLCSIALTSLGYFYSLDEVIRISLTPLLILALLIIKEVIIEYRIRNGLFGNNAHEAKDIIEFLVRNAQDIDFTDGKGKLRQVLIASSQGAADGSGFAGIGVGA